MSPHRYSEDKLIEQTCMDMFQTQLHWQVFDARKEKLGIDGSLGREKETDVLLKGRFMAALQKFNPGLPPAAYALAYEQINETSSIHQLPETNRDKYNLLREGIPVTYKDAKGVIHRDKKLKVYDFDNAANNDFIAVQQMRIIGKANRRRIPDIIGFVNGLPLLFMELKAHHRKLRAAYNDNFSDYLDVLPRLFHCNVFVILSNGLESKIGSITSKYGHFHDWKRINEQDEGIVSLDTILRGVCDKTHFLDLFENFILFDDSSGQVVKLVARNHQYLGVNKAYQHFLDQEERYKAGEISLEEKQRLGVFWHTQGSGKSYSMVFICQKLLRKQGGYTFLLLTDRSELDAQIYGTFSGVGAVADKAAQATGGENLQTLLSENHPYIFSLIHKFNFEKEITQRENIIVISDEAHRTQSGTLAMNMRKALPNASFLGFTGTPLFKDDELTRRIFGDYVSVYDFKRSIEDGATVPLYYENRGEKLKLDNPKFNEDIREAIEAADLDPMQEEKLTRLFRREYPILTAEKRLRAIAKDLVYHFNQRGYKGKAMLVCLDKLTAVKMYNLIAEEWRRYLTEEERRIEKMTDVQEILIAKRNWKWTQETEVAVVVSDEQNEMKKFRDHGLNIEPHREKMRVNDLEKDFKDEDHPFRLAIVCAMWITGFDVPSLSTLYLDKPMRAHTLMQAIARANRVNEGKNNGLIVDYIETYKNLLEALAIYAVGGNKLGGGGGGTTGGPEPPVRPLEELIADLDNAIQEVESYLLQDLKFDLKQIIESEGMELLKAIAQAENAVNYSDESRAKFGVMANEVFRKYKALMPRKEVEEFRDRRNAIDAIARRVQGEIDEADVSGVIQQVQEVVNRSIESLDIALDRGQDYGVKVDLGALDFDLIEKLFKKTENKQTAFQSLRQRVEQRLTQMLNQNPLRINFYEHYNDIIADYNKGKDRVTIEQAFQDLVNLVRDMTKEASRAQREGLEESHLAIFDLLKKGKELSTKDKNAIKAIAKELLEKLLANQLKIDHWKDKTQTASAVKTVIQDFLFEKLPYPTYVDEDIASKTESLFEHIKIQFGDAA